MIHYITMLPVAISKKKFIPISNSSSYSKKESFTESVEEAQILIFYADWKIIQSLHLIW